MGTHQYEYASGDRVWEDGLIAARIIRRLRNERQIRTVLDAGCGNGNLSARLGAEGLDVCAFDASSSGIEHARRAFSGIQFEVASVYDDLLERFGQTFDACVSVEVIEHLYDPRLFVSRIFQVLRPGGLFIVTTPYHGYLKNVALAISGRMDSHYSVLWDGGHIKFWSRATMTVLLREAGFYVVGFEGTGRIPLLWKSMIVTARKI